MQNLSGVHVNNATPPLLNHVFHLVWKRYSSVPEPEELVEEIFCCLLELEEPKIHPQK